jgi:hypothetical protein
MEHNPANQRWQARWWVAEMMADLPILFNGRHLIIEKLQQAV